jgi:hypothetical protein
MEVNCAEDCINGCVLGADCPHLEFQQAASKFIQERSMDELLEIAAESLRKKYLAAAPFPPPEVDPRPYPD